VNILDHRHGVKGYKPKEFSLAVAFWGVKFPEKAWIGIASNRQFRTYDSVCGET
jgi:hypothetical protein